VFKLRLRNRRNLSNTLLNVRGRLQEPLTTAAPYSDG
jgi:hypothetical protein